MKAIKIDNRRIALDEKPYIVAELSANHNGSLDEAKRLIALAKKSGANAVKLQTYTPDTITINCDKPDFKISDGLWEGYTLYDLYVEAHTPFEWHKELFEYSRTQKITCFSSPFDESAVDLLEDLNCPAYKIASFEAIDLPLIKYVASTKKPMIISTGMANKEEISEALEVARSQGNKQIILLHCISAYPAPLDQANLKMVNTLARDFNVLTGLSDHTLGNEAALASVALGSVFIEKHFTHSRNDKGPDSSFSMEPHDLERLATMTSAIKEAIGNGGYQQAPSESQNRVFRRSLYVVKDIKKGQALTRDNIRSIRPGYGLEPKHLDKCIGKIAVRDLERGSALSWDDIKID
ncbi:pseudaminic acid synthase [Bermanella marisrubri]|uniref:NeuB protein n=1 Tax=Bermanella marisrubri TaxID=207949 RepID=Q1N2Y9_9GAMM|nr:pseudaminic acid synthase [Bermanella marisrubri]EAT12530.1 neuB protein [Oceanobacter sp. RED65] [Bermanella marisrubri]